MPPGVGGGTAPVKTVPVIKPAAPVASPAAAVKTAAKPQAAAAAPMPPEAQLAAAQGQIVAHGKGPDPSALASVVLCWLYISNTRELRSLQTQAAQINNDQHADQRAGQ